MHLCSNNCIYCTFESNIKFWIHKISTNVSEYNIQYCLLEIAYLHKILRYFCIFFNNLKMCNLILHEIYKIRVDLTQKETMNDSTLIVSASTV